MINARAQHWGISCKASLLQTHVNAPGRFSYECACAALSEITEFVAEFHGRDTAVATLHNLMIATEANLPLPVFTALGAPVLVPPVPTPPKSREIVGKIVAKILRTWWVPVIVVEWGLIAAFLFL